MSSTYMRMKISISPCININKDVSTNEVMGKMGEFDNSVRKIQHQEK
jgi:hypothetical protein